MSQGQLRHAGLEEDVPDLCARDEAVLVLISCREHAVRAGLVGGRDHPERLDRGSHRPGQRLERGVQSQTPRAAGPGEPPAGPAAGEGGGGAVSDTTQSGRTGAS